MTTKAFLRTKDEADQPRRTKKGVAERSLRSDFGESESRTGLGVENSETADESGEIPEDELGRFCQNRFRKCCMYGEIDSSTESDGSYVPYALKKLMKKIGTEKSSDPRKKSKFRSKILSRKSSQCKNRDKLSKHLSIHCTKQAPKDEIAKPLPRSRKLVPLKEEISIQKSAASKSSDKDWDIGGHSRSSRILAISSKNQIHQSEGTKRRKSIVEILLDPTIDQKEAERMLTEMHKQARDNRVVELEVYLEEVKRAIRTLDIEEGVADEDDRYWVDLSPHLDDFNEEEEKAGKMDAQAMRTMLTALAGREAKEDAVASVANVGANWRNVPHDQLNCCLSMDPKLLGDHRRRVKRNYEEFDNVFRPQKEPETKKMQHPEDENEDTVSVLPEEPKPEKPKPKEGEDELEETEPMNIAELTREQMIQIHDKIGPWVHHHTRKLDKFIQSRKYTPQYLLNHWNGEISDDDSEVDFEKYRSAWKKKLEDRENPGDGNPENQPPPIQLEDQVPTLQENNWFLFPTPMTRSYSTEADESGWDGQRTRPFSQVAMEGLVKYLKRQQEEEKSKKFLRENPWPPPSRYPPEVKIEREVKYLGRDLTEDEGDDSKRKVPS